jgi:hypothetical protein
MVGLKVGPKDRKADCGEEKAPLLWNAVHSDCEELLAPAGNAVTICAGQAGAKSGLHQHARHNGERGASIHKETAARRTVV